MPAQILPKRDKGAPLGREKENPSAPTIGTKGETFRGTTQLRAKRRALKAPVTEGGTGRVSTAAPGRTKRRLADGLSAGGLSSLGKAESLFSRSSRIQNIQLNYYI